MKEKDLKMVINLQEDKGHFLNMASSMNSYNPTAMDMSVRNYARNALSDAYERILEFIDSELKKLGVELDEKI